MELSCPVAAGAYIAFHRAGHGYVWRRVARHYEVNLSVDDGRAEERVDFLLDWVLREMLVAANRMAKAAERIVVPSRFTRPEVLEALAQVEPRLEMLRARTVVYDMNGGERGQEQLYQAARNRLLGAYDVIMEMLRELEQGNYYEIGTIGAKRELEMNVSLEPFVRGLLLIVEET